MEAQDLRIGNLLQYGNTVFMVDSIGRFGVNGIGDNEQVVRAKYNAVHLRPIPLTEEWLLKLGFIEKDSVFFKGRFQAQKFANWTGFMFCEGSNILREIKYLHTLQNLYFALTGEELAAK